MNRETKRRLRAQRAEIRARRGEVKVRLREARAQLAAARAEARARAPAKPSRWRRRALVVALLLLLLLLLRDCSCDEAGGPPPPPPPPPPAVETATVPPPKKTPVKRRRPPIRRRVKPTARPGYEPPPKKKKSWLDEFRMQVGARSVRLSACFEGVERPGAVRWVAAIDPATGKVSDHALEPIASRLALTRGQQRCLIGVLSTPAYRLTAEDTPSTPERVGIALEF